VLYEFTVVGDLLFTLLLHCATVLLMLYAHVMSLQLVADIWYRTCWSFLCDSRFRYALCICCCQYYKKVQFCYLIVCFGPIQL